MSAEEAVPCARSEPQNIGDEVVSELLRLAADVLECRANPQDPKHSPFAASLLPLLSAVENDAMLTSLAQKLPLALGGGFLLQSLFTRLFPVPPQPFAVPRNLDDLPRLTSREKEILLRLAQGRKEGQIAEELFISKGAVHKHINNIFNKFKPIEDKAGEQEPGSHKAAETAKTQQKPGKKKTTNATEVVLKAAAWGLISFDLVTLMEPLAKGQTADFTHLMQVLLWDTDRDSKTVAGDMLTQMTQLGLLLFVMSALLLKAKQYHAEQEFARSRQGRIFEYTPDGKLLRTLDGGGQLCDPHGLAFAPQSAKKHGFQPGYLYVINHRTQPDPLNTTSILELTPDGDPCCSFTGGAYLSTRLFGSNHLAFMQDGRLMLDSGWNTDAVLEFTDLKRTEAGHQAQVRRFAGLVPYGGMAAGRGSKLYVVGGGWHRVPVKVFSPEGELLHEIGDKHTHQSGEQRFYDDIAIGSNGDVYVANIRQGCIEVYDSAGNRRDTISRREWRCLCCLTFSADGILYVLDGTPEKEGLAVWGYDAARRVWTTRFAAPAGVKWNALTIGPNGNIFVTGQVV